MKKIVYFLLALLFLSSCSNDPAVDAAFAKYSGHQGVISVTVPGFVIKTATAFGDFSPAEKDLLRNIDKVKVLAIDDEYSNPNVNFYNEFNHLLADKSYTELLTVKEDDNNIKVLAQMIDDEEINNLVVMVGGEDNALVFVKGSFTLDQIARVAKHHNGGRGFFNLTSFN